MVIVTIVMTLFLYLIFQASLLSPPSPSPDFSWLNTRNLSVYVRPQEQTALMEPRPSPCKSVSESPVIRLLVAVFSAPRNKEARSVIRFIRRFVRNNSYNLVTQEDMGEEVS